ncbi:MAG: sugar transferase, partial [Acidimicrobiales bacterium]
QERPGLGGRPFTIMKFRTMRAPRPGEVYYLTDDERTTRLGRLLRTTSLDELREWCCPPRCDIWAGSSGGLALASAGCIRI